MMKDSPVVFAIKIVVLTLFLFWVLAAAQKASGEEYAVPYSGSPYRDMGTLDEGEIVHLPTGSKVTLNQMIDTVSGSRVIYIGETHDNLEEHRVQLQVIRRLADRGKIAVGMEMFRRSAQKDLDRYNRGELPDKQFRKLFRRNWGSGYKLYQPIFDFLKQRSIPLIGLKSTHITEAAFRGGDPAPGLGFYPEIDETDPYHKAYAMSIFGGHGDHSEPLTSPYRILLLWEETMAQTVAEFLLNKANRDRKLVVLAGGFHVQYGFGIPKRAFRRVPHPYSIILPTVTKMPEELKETREMDVEHISIPLYSADFAWKVAYRVLPEKKIKLGVMLREEDTGVRVTAVSKNSNAERAGIRHGDLLLQADGNDILDVEALVDFLQTKNFGDRVRLHLKRNSEQQDVNVELQAPKK